MNEIKHITIKDLTSAPDNLFKVQMDSEMEQLIESMRKTGSSPRSSQEKLRTENMKSSADTVENSPANIWVCKQCLFFFGC